MRAALFCEAMARRGGHRTAFLWFVHDQLPGLERRGLSVACVGDAVPYCSQAWESLTEEEKTMYAEKARTWNNKKRAQKTVKEVNAANGRPSVRRRSTRYQALCAQFHRILCSVPPALHILQPLEGMAALVVPVIIRFMQRELSEMADKSQVEASVFPSTTCSILEDCNPGETCKVPDPVPAPLATKMPCVTPLPDASALSWKNDQDMVADIFYFLDIYSYGRLPPHCEQRFLPCEIGCVRYSLQDGILADFHHFIDPEVPPRGFRYHCQAASDETHKIPISGFHHPRSCYAVVLRELVEFAQPARGAQPRFFCRSNDRFRINWCLGRMASITGIESHWELFAVEDLIMKLYQKKYQKEPSNVWVFRKLDVCLWDFSSNTRCKWHEENDIICCALASCKKMGYCISKSFAGVYGVPLTAAHLPLQDSDCDQGTNTRIVKLDAGHNQKMKAESSGCNKPLGSPRQDQEFVPSNCDSPCGVKTSPCGTSVVQGRGVIRLLRSASDLSKSFSN